MKKLIEKKIKCKSDWQKKKNRWKQDYIWVQELSNGCNKMLISQFQLILSIRNPGKLNNKGKLIYDYGILLNLLQPQNKSISNIIIGMVKMQSWPLMVGKNSRNLRALQMFNLSIVQQSIRMMPDRGDEFYVSNYLDWNTYNIVYNSDFLNNCTKRAKKYKKQQYIYWLVH